MLNIQSKCERKCLKFMSLSILMLKTHINKQHTKQIFNRIISILYCDLCFCFSIFSQFFMISLLQFYFNKSQRLCVVYRKKILFFITVQKDHQNSIKLWCIDESNQREDQCSSQKLRVQKMGQKFEQIFGILLRS